MYRDNVSLSSDNVTLIDPLVFLFVASSLSPSYPGQSQGFGLPSLLIQRYPERVIRIFSACTRVPEREVNFMEGSPSFNFEFCTRRGGGG